MADANAVTDFLRALAEDGSSAIRAASATVALGVLGYLGKEFAKHRDERRSARHRSDVLRVEILAELNAFMRLLRGQIEFASDADQPRFLWMPFFLSHLPSRDNIKRLEPLTSGEVEEVVSYYRSYQEHTGYIIMNSERRPEIVKDDYVLPIGYNLSDDKIAGYLIWSQEHLLRAATQASNTLCRKLGRPLITDVEDFITQSRMERHTRLQQRAMAD